MRGPSAPAGYASCAVLHSHMLPKRSTDPRPHRRSGWWRWRWPISAPFRRWARCACWSRATLKWRRRRVCRGSSRSPGAPSALKPVHILLLLWLPFCVLCRLGRLLRRRFHRVSLEGASRGEFAQFVAHHIFGDVHRDKFFAVMHRDGVPDELRQNRGTPRPGPQDLLLTSRVQRVEPLLEMVVGEWSFFNGSSHVYLFFDFLFTMNLSVRLLLRVLKSRVGLPQGVP